MATTPMGEQLSPRSMLALIGMPMEWQISATEGELEFWMESQQYCFSVMHWSDLNQKRSQRSVSKAIHTRKNETRTYGEGMARAPATKAATTKNVLENIFEIRRRER